MHQLFKSTNLLEINPFQRFYYVNSSLNHSFRLLLQPIFEDMTQFTEEEKTIRRIERRFNKGVVQYGLIEEGDKILIGLSGGKRFVGTCRVVGQAGAYL